jgi:sugar phosphate isomerase/epimerase
MKFNMKKAFTGFIIICMVFTISCNTKSTKEVDMLDKDNLIAWCIVPFDANERTPIERAKMLNELGLKKYAYDYRDKHIPQFEEEIKTMKTHDIVISAVWLWIQDTDENLLDPTSEAIVSIAEMAGLHTEFWISFPHEFFDGLSDDEMLDKSVETIRRLNERLVKSDCSIALYNHGAWFGNPENQIRIIEAIGTENIGIVYNFHHAHHEVDKFETLFPQMLPYLRSVNLNGMKKDGPKIITLGEGDEELGMLQIMKENGYEGPVGIIGHTEGEDIKLVLERNLEGLEKLREAI